MEMVSEIVGRVPFARALVDHPLQYLSLNRNHIRNDGVLELARVLTADMTL
jgi:hypothetical protein